MSELFHAAQRGALPLAAWLLKPSTSLNNLFQLTAEDHTRNEQKKSNKHVVATSICHVNGKAKMSGRFVGSSLQGRNRTVAEPLLLSWRSV